MKTKLTMTVLVVAMLLSACATTEYRSTNLQSDEAYKSDKTIADLKTRVEQNDVDAMLQLAYVYANTNLGKLDLNKANALNERAASLDSMPANAIVASRRYEYATRGYQRNDALASSYVDRAYVLYQQRTDWSKTDQLKMAGALARRSRATGNLTDVCKALQIAPEHLMAKEILGKRSCK